MYNCTWSKTGIQALFSPVWAPPLHLWVLEGRLRTRPWGSRISSGHSSWSGDSPASRVPLCSHYHHTLPSPPHRTIHGKYVTRLLAVLKQFNFMNFTPFVETALCWNGMRDLRRSAVWDGIKHFWVIHSNVLCLNKIFSETLFYFQARPPSILWRKLLQNRQC